MNKAVTLIIAVFFMMMLALIAWSIVKFMSTDMEVNSRLLDSERALYLAEAGGEWALNRLRDAFDCDIDGDGQDIDSGTALHSLKYGQYRVDCSCDQEQCNGKITIDSKGFISSESQYRAFRNIEYVIEPGSFTNSGTVKILFDWSQMHSGSDIDGDVKVLVNSSETDRGFEGPDANTVTNQPDDYLVPGDGQRITQVGTYPGIDMDYFKDTAIGYGRYVDYKSEAMAHQASGGSTLRVTKLNFFTGKTGEAVRNLDDGTWNNSNWAVIEKVENQGREAELDRTIGDDWDKDKVRIVKRFSGNHNNEGLWYIEGSDAIIDSRDAKTNLNHTSIVAEGDIVQKGTMDVAMKTHVVPATHETFPNVATEYGNIYLTSVPDRGEKGRTFDGLIYTENGDVHINFIDGIAIMGTNVYLDGVVKLKYSPKYVDSEGLFGDIELFSWQEK
jgi:hypothetical protein